jgi:hypothetical protein
MNILAIWAAHKAVLTSGLAIGIPSAVRADSLDSFALGALMAGACFLVVTSSRGPWRSLFTRRERAAAAGAHRSPSRWVRTGRPRAEVRRVVPRHAAHQAGLASRMAGLLPGRAMAGRAMVGEGMAGGVLAAGAMAGSAGD